MELGKVNMLQAAFVTFFIACFNKLWDPVAAYIGHPFNLARRVSDLLDAVERLRQVQADLLRLDPHPSSERCKGWLYKANELRANAESIKSSQNFCGRWHYFGRCKIGKEAEMELKKVNQLATDGKDLLQEARASPRPLPVFTRQHPQHELCGMKPYKDKVVDFLKCKEKDQVGMLGIWGMGGVGKSALLKIVRDSQAAHYHFDHVIFVRAGRGCTVEKMTHSIISGLGLSPGADFDAIKSYLQCKSFLLLIDDIWDFICLEDIGIPFPLGCVKVSPDDDVTHEFQRKIVFTTRNWKVCAKMKCHKNSIHMDCLSSENSWNLFTENVGDRITKDNPIYQFANKMVAECGGLPKALCTIGRAMSTKRESRDWIAAIDLLNESKLSELNDMDEELFECLKLSYDSLPDTMKACFLLCSLWLEDENIPRNKLIEWWIGEGLLAVPNPVHRGHHIISTLLETSLLQNGDSGLFTAETSHVKMHRMMRRMALWVVNDSGGCGKWIPHSHGRLDMTVEEWRVVRKVWVSLAHTKRFSYSVHCPQLTMLVTRDNFPLQSIVSFREILFLDLDGTRRDTFPMEVCSLVNLQYLSMSGTKINSLPAELKRLSNLRYLYMRDCAHLQTIAKGLILQLKKLVVLDLFCPGGAHKVQYFASLMEELLSNNPDVIMFGINLQSRADLTKVLQSSRLCTLGVCLDHFVDEKDPCTIDLSFLSPLNSLRELTVVKSSLCTEVIAQGNHSDNNYGLFPRLESLELSCLPKLQKVRWMNAGKDICAVVIYKCCRLRHATWVLSLPNLNELTITYCAEMDHIINDAEMNAMASPMTVGFRSLKRLYLEQLPQLSNVSEHGFPFDDLSYVYVDRCENLKAIKVQGRVNPLKITIDCNTNWWSAQGMMNPHFVRRFSL